MPTITLINNVSVSGNITYGPVFVPAGITGIFTLKVILDNATILDPTKSISFEVDESSDGGLTWQFNFGFTWAGSPTNPPNPNTGLLEGPWVSINAAELAGKQVRARAVIPNPINLTAQVIY